MTSRALGHLNDAASFAPMVRVDARPGGADVDFIMRQRQRGASWAAIAGMLRCSEDAVRAIADPDYEPPPWRASAPRRAPPAGWRPPTTVARMLVALEAGPSPFGELCEALDLDAISLSSALTAARKVKRVAFEGVGSRGAWKLTDKGADWLAAQRNDGSAAQEKRVYAQERKRHPDRGARRAALLALLRVGPATSAALAEALGTITGTIASQALGYALTLGHARYSGSAGERRRSYSLTLAGAAWLAEREARGDV